MDTMSGRLIELSKDHKYFVDGIRRAGVTEVLKHFGITDFSMVPDRLREKAKARGRQVHAACKLLDDNNLDPASVAPELRGYMRGYIAFKRDTGFDITASEETHYHPRYEYCGTLDRRGILQKRRALLEIKTTMQLNERATIYQLAAYHEFLGAFHPAYAVQLMPDGKYRLWGPYLTQPYFPKFYHYLYVFQETVLERKAA
jgi:hypothetical protein